MAALPEFKVDVARNLGKKLYQTFIDECAVLDILRVNAAGEVLSPKRQAFTRQELVDYLLEEYAVESGHVAGGKHAYCKGKTLEEVFLEYALPFYRKHAIYDIGVMQSFAAGDFSHLYRAVLQYLRYYYAGDVYPALLRGEGFTPGNGTDHGTYLTQAIASFAVMRPDYARRFFPRSLGLVRRSHPLINNMGSLIMSLMYDDAEWKEQSLEKARKFLQGKRKKSEHAAVSYLANLCEGDADGMSADLQELMDNYRKATWLIIGEGCRVALYGLYLMGAQYLPAETFARVKRPQGPGWWDAYVDLCLQKPLPANLDEAFIVFPEPLGFANEAMKNIDKEPPEGSVIVSIDIKRA